MISQPEFEGFPPAQHQAADETQLARYCRLNREGGGLLPTNLLPELLGVSRARLSQFVKGGRIEVVKFDGLNFVSFDELQRFVENDRSRKAGRPRKVVIDASKDIT
jgi:hypothetical protein